MKPSAKLFQCNIFKICLKIFDVSEDDFFSQKQRVSLRLASKPIVTDYKTQSHLANLRMWREEAWLCLFAQLVGDHHPGGVARTGWGGEGFSSGNWMFCGRCVFFPFVKGKTLVTLYACCQIPVNCFKKSPFYIPEKKSAYCKISRPRLEGLWSRDYPT